MSAWKNIALADYFDVLNEKAIEISKYEGFYPARYLVEDNSATEMTLKTISTSGEETATPNYEMKISKLSPYDKNWFEHAAEAQIAVYQSVLDVLKDLNKNNKYFIQQEDGKFHYANKKAKNNSIVNDELSLIELSTFRSLSKFRNVSIADMVKPRKEETLDSIKEKTNSLINQVRDAIARMRYIDNTPDYNMAATIKEDSVQLEITLNGQKIVWFTNDWKTIDVELAYNRLVSLCNAERAIEDTIEFFRDLIGITEPRLYVSKVLSKKWKITNAGQQYMTCLEIVNLIKEIFGFDKQEEK